ncbi:NAD(P)-dependent oxidoreductase [Pseudonocardia kunmingensis]|uniref:D-3-phosphoglycerate dehydrogenase/(S)-sulfolactate dehydrogenase n=1 Tax=Pseudonocardia kunmingensis TaxID=630975 RepID=A0A543DQI1_9PSEU|nr:NAD(P)-dependent oxidoreductase [Pseudonocardia kunmingensis]TQM11558.1 D-3-phosphoglycerate dehydrogenase/(S)-sulfolactate dehydrogenase [Pseudonocardia kunmingensis]
MSILVTEDVWGDPLRALGDRHPIQHAPELWKDRGGLLDALRGATALVVRNRTQVDAELLAAAPDLRIVARAGVGLDNIDVTAADDAGVVVAAPLGANARSVAEHALGLALALARNTVERDRDTRAGGWNRAPGRELRGGTWGLLGAGATARECGKLADAFGMRAIAYDPYVEPTSPALVEAGIRLAPLTEVVAHADVVSCHLPATAETEGFVGESLLARMRPHTLFVNVGRGEVVDEEALADALEAGRLAGAALDVRATEPPPGRGRLEDLPTTILTPHIAGITHESQQAILQVLAADIDAVLSGGEARAMVGAVRRGRAA